MCYLSQLPKKPKTRLTVSFALMVYLPYIHILFSMHGM